MNRLIISVLSWLIYPIFLLIAFSTAFFVRCLSNSDRQRLVWGSTPIISYAYWSNAMKVAGYDSETYTNDYYKTINKREDWNRIVSEDFPLVPAKLKPLFAFITSIYKYDIFFISYDGFFIGEWPFAFFQSEILKLARKKIVVLPYGGDSYVYRRIRSVATMHGLMMSYPLGAKKQNRIAAKVDYWTQNADAVIPGIMAPDGFGRSDMILHSSLSINLSDWTTSKKKDFFDGKNGVVTITHSPNHRGFKGTEFLISTVDKLKKDGYKVELKLLEKIQNSEVRRILTEDTDILVEALICNGHGMSGLEGMASGLPTITNIEDDSYMLPVRRWSYFNECPLISASPETLEKVLIKLITQPNLRISLGIASRAYVEKYHGFDSAQYLFTNVIEYIYGRKDSIINLYHPLLGEYTNRSPKIKHPLVNNRIID